MKYIKLILIVSLSIAQFGCGGAVSSCAEDDIKYFDIEDLNMESPFLSPIEPVSHSAVEFNFSASKIRYYASNTYNFDILDMFISKAYASCGLNSKEQIHSISISVTPGYFSNQTLNDNMELFFDVMLGLEGNPVSTSRNINSIVKNGVYASREFSIRLNKEPDNTGTYTFSIKYSHVGGETFEFVSDAIEIIGANDL